MREFKLDIVTPDGEEFSGNAESLLVYTDDGVVEVLAGHVDYMASLGTGKARVRFSDGERIASASGGFLTVDRGEVTLVATTFEWRDDIDVERAKAAKENAEALIKDAKDERAMAFAKAKLMRALNRLNVAEG